MSEEPKRFERLQNNSELMHDGLVKACVGTKFHVQGNSLSPIQHIYWGEKNDPDAERYLNILVEEVIFFKFKNLSNLYIFYKIA